MPKKSQTRSVKVLIATGQYGSGHNSATQALLEQFAKYGDEVKVEVFDFSEASSKLLDQANRWAYNFTATHLPSLYRAFVGFTDSDNLLNTFNTLSRPLSGRGLEKRLKKFKPDIVVSNLPFINRLVGSYKKAYHFKFFAVVLELTTVHNYWICDQIDRYIIALDEMKSVFGTLFVKPSKLKVIGYPLREQFFVKKSQNDLRKKLKLREQFTILQYLHTAPESFAPEVAEALDADPDVQAIFICGRNRSIYRDFKKRFKKSLVTGYVKNVADYVRASDLVIGKGGPGIMLETFALERPMIVSSFIAPQEFGNVELMLRFGCGWAVNNAKDILRIVKKVQKMPKKDYAKIIAKQKKMVWPNATSKIVKYILQSKKS